MIQPWLLILSGLLGAASGYLANIIVTKMRVASAETDADRLRENARREAESILKDAELEAKDEVIRAREDFEKETRERRRDLLSLEERISQRETNLDRKINMLDKKEQSLDVKIEDLEQHKTALMSRQAEVDRVIAKEEEELQRVAALSRDEARGLLMRKIEDEIRQDSGNLIRRVQDELKTSAEKEARRIITMAIERYAADQVSEITTCSVALPNDEMKGRIIGREGRNIRSIESVTGVNVLIDDTPEVVVISGFDPLRREIARIALETLIADGRIHPARIEEVVSKVKADVNEAIHAAGEEAIYTLRLHGVPPDLMRLVGQLKFRHSYGQNVLKHSVEMGHIMGMMADELGLDASIAKRIGLFHDVGKAIDHTVEGSHALIGADILKKHGELPVVFNAVAAHHDEVEAKSLYAVLCKAADAITAARPGARSETTEIYLKRLEKLEDIAKRFRGVDKCYAIQAGRELRVIVEPSQIDDSEAMTMARNISMQVEQEVHYPGQIKVTVVRETRCVEYAR